MNIRKCIFTILLVSFTYQYSIFAHAKDSNESDMYMAILSGKSGGSTPESDKLGEPNDFITELIPQSEEYFVGKPMKFDLVLKNVRDSVKKYDYGVIFYRPLIVKAADNNEPYYKLSPGQMVDSWRSIGPNEVVPLFENLNIANEFVIIKPGKYKVQFRGGRNLPESNVIEIEVKPGTPNQRDYLIYLLVDVIPDANWHAEIRPMFRSAPAGRKEEAISIALRHPHPDRYAGVFVTLWQTRMPAEVIENADDREISEYLGKNPSGYFYLEIPPEALDYWPKIKEDIAKALKLDSH
ncbi:MAG: hypothetical protein JW749_09560 [Sedimentisphaerales bacterium]|nr:hypothetical protein [Sedimentisphaerales bacterium]